MGRPKKQGGQNTSELLGCGEGAQFPSHTESQHNVSQMFQKYFSNQKAQLPCHLPPSNPLEVAGSLADNNKPMKGSGPKAKSAHLAQVARSSRPLPPQGEGTLVLQLDGRVPLLRQRLRLLQQTLVLLLQLLQAAQVRVMDGHLLAVPLPQGIVVLLDHLQLVHGRVIELVENL